MTLAWRERPTDVAARKAALEPRLQPEQELPAQRPEAVQGYQQPILDQITRTSSFLHSAKEIPFHWHHEMEILYVLRGSVQIVLDGQLCGLAAGDVMIINSDVPHNSISSAPDTLICGLLIDTARYQAMGVADFSHRAYLCKSFLHDKSYHRKLQPLKALLARMLLDDRQNPNNTAIHLATAISLCSYIALTFPYQTVGDTDAGQQKSGRGRVLRIMELISANSGVSSLSAIAEMEGLTLSHLSRLFKNQTGMHFRDYLQNTRLDRVAWDLLHQSAPIFEIMEQRNVGNPAHFFRKFKDRFGCSPATFRKTVPPSSAGATVSAEAKDAAVRLLAEHLADIGMGFEQALHPVSKAKQAQLAVSALHQF